MTREGREIRGVSGVSKWGLLWKEADFHWFAPLLLCRAWLSMCQSNTKALQNLVEHVFWLNCTDTLANRGLGRECAKEFGSSAVSSLASHQTIRLTKMLCFKWINKMARGFYLFIIGIVIRELRKNASVGKKCLVHRGLSCRVFCFPEATTTSRSLRVFLHILLSLEKRRMDAVALLCSCRSWSFCLSESTPSCPFLLAAVMGEDHS